MAKKKAEIGDWILVSEYHHNQLLRNSRFRVLSVSEKNGTTRRQVWISTAEQMWNLVDDQYTVIENDPLTMMDRLEPEDFAEMWAPRDVDKSLRQQRDRMLRDIFGG
jgi:hypothetical protein